MGAYPAEVFKDAEIRWLIFERGEFKYVLPTARSVAVSPEARVFMQRLAEKQMRKVHPPHAHAFEALKAALAAVALLEDPGSGSADELAGEALDAVIATIERHRARVDA